MNTNIIRSKMEYMTQKLKNYEDTYNVSMFEAWQYCLEGDIDKAAETRHAAIEEYYFNVKQLYFEVITLFSGCLTDALACMDMWGWSEILEYLGI